jgi:adenosylcobinamide kinase / adenosylcobinamide-phosphate guanylyltransferase
MGKLILVTGGARSGKSSYALQRCEEISVSRCFVATSPVIDGEMAERIDAHQQERRGRGWQVVEEERDLVLALAGMRQYGVVLIDCLTLWVNNLLFAADKKGGTFSETDMVGACDDLLQAVQACPGTVCCVTNEVGMGIVPDNFLARKYRDLIGRCNRTVAERADEVILVSCGIPLFLKRP